MTAQAGAILNTSSAWDAVDWRTTEGNVRRLQARIVKAVQQKKWNKVKALQHLLTHSASGKLLAVRRVTVNDGRKTPGVDGELWDTPHKKLQGVISLTARGYRPMPMRRIYIPKANGKLRPLGIRLQARLRTTRWLPRKTSILRYDLWHTAGRNHIACLWGWAHARHRRKGAGWIKQKYFDRVGTRDWWFFGDTVDARGSPLRVRLFPAASVRIVRHVKVRSGLNPYDPSWTPYLSRRYAAAPHRARS
jgi:hypothetical protein